MKKMLYLCLFAIEMTGCATASYEFQFSTQSVTPGKPASRLCKVHYMNNDENTIDGKYYVPQVEELLKNKGIVVVKGETEDVDCLITISHSTSYGKEQRIGQTWGQTGVSGSTSYTNASASVYGVGNSAYGYGQSTTYTTYRPTYGVTGTYTYDVARSYNGLYLQAVNTKTGEELWNSAISYAGNVNEKFTDLFPAFKCILSYNMLKNFTQTIFVSQKQINQMYKGQCSEILWGSASKEERRAHWGNAEAQVKLGSMYFWGQGQSVDYAKAFYWFSKAAEQGHPVAERTLAMLYMSGEGTEQNLSKAFDWFSKAAEQGDADAQARLGLLYILEDADFNKYVPNNPEKALYWLNKSIEQNNSYGKAILAELYYRGEHIKQDMTKAFELYKQVQTEVPVAKARLACYSPNVRTLKQHFDKCLLMAKQGNIQAQIAVAAAYNDGLGTKKDPRKAYEWIEKVAKQDPEYEETRKALAKELSNKK